MPVSRPCNPSLACCACMPFQHGKGAECERICVTVAFMAMQMYTSNQHHRLPPAKIPKLGDW